MADKNERAQLGEQAEGDPMIARPTQADSNDLNAGDEGVDDSRSNLARGSRMSRKAGFKTAGGDNSNQDSAESSADDETDGKKTDSKETDPKETDPNESGARDASSMRGTRTSGDSGEFEGQGGQKDGDYENAQGTGYTNDRTGQLQDDGSLSGSDHSTGDKSAGDKSTGDNKRVGGQTAQNPRK